MQTLLLSARWFARRHDELPAFHAAAIVLAFVIASLCTTGLFVLAITAHACLDWVKFRDVYRLSWRAAAAQAIRTNVVMATLILTGLTASMYLHPSFGLLAGLTGIALAEGSLVRGMAIVLPKFAVLRHLSGRWEALMGVHDPKPQAFGPVEKSFLALFVTALALLVAGPSLLHVPVSTYLLVLRVELTPGIL